MPSLLLAAEGRLRMPATKGCVTSHDDVHENIYLQSTQQQHITVSTSRTSVHTVCIGIAQPTPIQTTGNHM
jgi:hypothetical protein